MLFHTSKFLVFFLVVLSVYWALPRHRWRMLWLLGASIFFYMSWNPWLISLIFFSTSVDYLAARGIEASSAPRTRRALLLSSVGVNLAILGIFKYTNFFIHSACQVAGVFGWGYDPVLWDIILPLGISFYTFEAISYVVDVYRGRVRAVKSLLDYGLYILFFPHLIAGPIVRSHDFLPQLHRRKHWQWERGLAGVQLVLIGLFKKAILADNLARVVDPVFQSPSDFGSGSVWLAVVAYSMQIYCDFSGYSDMAVGLAHLLGFKLPRNFNLPYLADSLGDFWRRWHISLSSWLRDYLYVRLGGNRGGVAGTCRNLILTMLLGGLWHGASWTFVAWGLLHGVLLAAERCGLLPTRLFPRPLAVAWTFLIVTVGWVFFRAQSFADAAVILERLVQPAVGTALSPSLVRVGVAAILTLALGMLFRAGLSRFRVGRRLPAPVLGAALAGFFLLTQMLFPEGNLAFIYFQF